MKASFLAVFALQAIMAVAAPSTENNDKTSAIKARVPAELLNMDLGGLAKRNCDYTDCDGCLGRYGACQVCNNFGSDGPGPCANW
ncbi:hypothetical protein AJ79_09197 [Helicocarpus griseus UAMH5409]|uniref:Uncharacterized protein n=1 Tax=Helicocarpus griseus UAMH5409 TaxID=1447875 RepID=A0A2B7WLG2_9EURO|nr:hypothetical protein AJ79_09197 [Helicocarpus griseus UAMH5409]